MSYLIKELPLNERPRERLKKYGVTSLSNTELLSILLRTGTKNKSVSDLSYDILKKYCLKEFINLSFNELKQEKGIGEVKAMTIISALELSKRVLNYNDEIIHITDSNDIYNLVKNEMANELQEKFLVIFLDNRKNIILKKVMFIGTVNSSHVYPRDVFREAVRNNATAIILVHNHPAGSINPSYQDTYLTNEFIKIGKLMDIKVLDHVIIGRNDYYSFLYNNSEMFNL